MSIISNTSNLSHFTRTAVGKVFPQPNAGLDRAIAQITASSQTQLRLLPQGTTPPLIIAYSASSVPVMQLALSGSGLSEQRPNDYGLDFIRTQLITIPGTAVPYPYGGKQRQAQVDSLMWRTGRKSTGHRIERDEYWNCGSGRAVTSEKVLAAIEKSNEIACCTKSR